ncbi:hypothetical protein [Bacillus sp. SM2101]|uniref:hypothetical protein n=1 Tax=Bacillus sp. SM2101 TaxID=2805366 RepID=UPI001BDE577E|nr:hypothetical protein [Bacillus sp. SM2101]
MSISFYTTLDNTIIVDEQQGFFSCFQATADQVPSEVTVFSTLADPNQGKDIETFSYDSESGQFFPLNFDENGTIIFNSTINEELSCGFLLITFKKVGIYTIETQIAENNTFIPLFSSTDVYTVLDA